ERRELAPAVPAPRHLLVVAEVVVAPGPVVEVAAAPCAPAAPGRLLRRAGEAPSRVVGRGDVGLAEPSQQTRLDARDVLPDPGRSAGCDSRAAVAAAAALARLVRRRRRRRVDGRGAERRRCEQAGDGRALHVRLPPSLLYPTSAAGSSVLCGTSFRST